MRTLKEIEIEQHRIFNRLEELAGDNDKIPEESIYESMELAIRMATLIWVKGCEILIYDSVFFERMNIIAEREGLNFEDKMGVMKVDKMMDNFDEPDIDPYL